MNTKLLREITKKVKKYFMIENYILIAFSYYYRSSLL